MKNLVITVLLLITSTLLFSSTLIENLRFSAPTANGVITRGELDFFYDVSFYTFGDSGQVYHNFDFIEGSTNSYQGLLPAPFNNDIRFGIRAYNDVISETYAGVAVQPIPWDGADNPQFINLNWLGNDSTNDSAVNESFLDIIATHFTYNDEKLFFSIQNNGGGFPVSEAIWGPFYSYLSLIVPSGANVDPNDITITPFGLLYTINQAGIIQPGLYKINGMSMNDIEFIGSIETTIDETNNQLTLSCNWSDLYAQEEFMEWFDPEDPKFDTASGTGMITLTGGMQDADFTYPVAVYLEELVLEQEENSVPQIVEINPNEEDGYLYFTYFDEDGNFPLTVQAIIDEEETIEFESQSNDFSNEVIFKSTSPSDAIPENWYMLTVTISDNDINYVEETIYPVYNHDSAVFFNQNSIHNYPNPFNPETTIVFNIKKAGQVKIDIFNIKGQMITSLSDRFFFAGQHKIVWTGEDSNNEAVPSGIYLIRLSTASEKINHKVILLK